MSKRYLFLLCSLMALQAPISADVAAEATVDKIKEIPKEETVVTTGSIKIHSVDIPYKATAGTQILNDEKGNPKATFFYVAYTKDNVSETRSRPITFCFNGGPGSAAVWLHLGVFGPRRVNINEDGVGASQPYHLEDNPYSLLDITDLVFIDPISTGYSRAIQHEDAKDYHSVEGDISSVAEFIRLYITRNARWESPKFIAGESYGTGRAAGLAEKLQDEYFMNVNGLILISCALNYETFHFSGSNDLPYILFLPTYTATALYHNKLSAELQGNKQKTLKEVEEFAYGEYAYALMKGDKLSKEERQKVLKKLSGYTGLSEEYLDNSDLRIFIFRFAKELLKDRKRTLGRFDSRIEGIDTDLCGSTFEYDPSFELVTGLFTATFNNYVNNELKWKRDDEYKILANVQPWDYGEAKNQYLDFTGKLKDVMCRNPNLGVFVGSGYYDLGLPYFATEYTMTHLSLDPSLRDHVTMETYEGGHMMYLYHPTLVKMKEDLSNFMHQCLERAAK